ncbi:MAG: hypothetical protein ABI597_08460 [Gammaproteobacteria bacterium]
MEGRAKPGEGEDANANNYVALEVEGEGEPGNDQPQQPNEAQNDLRDPLNENDEKQAEDDIKEEGHQPEPVVQELICSEPVERYLRAMRFDYIYGVGSCISGLGAGYLGYLLKSNLPVNNLLIDTAMSAVNGALVPFKMRKMWPEVTWQAKAAILVVVSAGTRYVYNNFVASAICDPSQNNYCDSSDPFSFLFKDNFFSSLPIAILQRPVTHLAVKVTKCLSSLFSRCPEPEYDNNLQRDVAVVRRIN